MDNRERVENLKDLLGKVSQKALDIQKLKELKKKHRDNTVTSIKRMLTMDDIYYSTAPRATRRKIQKMASLLLKVSKLRRRMWYICEITRELTSKNITTVAELFNYYEAKKKPAHIIVRLRPGETSHDQDYIYIRVSIRKSYEGYDDLYIPQRMPMTTSLKTNIIDWEEKVEKLLNFTLQEFDEFERTFMEKVQKWLSK